MHFRRVSGRMLYGRASVRRDGKRRAPGKNTNNGSHGTMALYAIGDIQGCGAAFDALLRKLAFRPSRDRLWLVGDLVNRGPDSLRVLRRVMNLGRSVTCVLGNHDLHLLATVAGRRELSPADTFAHVLSSRDAEDIVDWLRHRPLLHHDA